LPKSVRDVDGLEDERLGTVSVFNGPEPVVVWPSAAGRSAFTPPTTSRSTAS
jgi:hypothetical protein